MLTRRSFFGTVAALAMSPLAAKAAPVAAETVAVAFGWQAVGGGLYVYGRAGEDIPQYSFVRRGPDGFTRVPRRDDGDTILELR